MGVKRGRLVFLRNTVRSHFGYNLPWCFLSFPSSSSYLKQSMTTSLNIHTNHGNTLLLSTLHNAYFWSFVWQSLHFELWQLNNETVLNPILNFSVLFQTNFFLRLYTNSNTASCCRSTSGSHPQRNYLELPSWLSEPLPRFKIGSLAKIVHDRENKEVTWSQIWWVSGVFHDHIRLFTKNSLTESAVCKGSLPWCWIHLSRNQLYSPHTMNPLFQMFQYLNRKLLVDSLTRWDNVHHPFAFKMPTVFTSELDIRPFIGWELVWKFPLHDILLRLGERRRSPVTPT
jgi:hypothetical protein